MNLTDFSGHRPDGLVINKNRQKIFHVYTLCSLELLGLGSPSNTACKPPEGNNPLMLFHVTKVSVCLDKLKTFDHLG